MISVVVPVHNGMPWLEEQIRALVKQTCPIDWEVVLVDDASSDGSADEIKRWAAGETTLRLVQLPRRSGRSTARNEGVRAARGDLLAFCDADDVVGEGWLAGMVDALGEADAVAGVFDFWSLNGPSSSGPIPAAMRQFGFLPAGLSANLGVRRVAFDDVGGFSEDLPVGEDIDLCWRLQLRGYRFQITGDCVVRKRDDSHLRHVFGRALGYGRCGPQLFKRYRETGARRHLLRPLGSWVLLLLSMPKLLVAPEKRRDWVRWAGVRIGRIDGSVRERVLFL